MITGSSVVGGVGSVCLGSSTTLTDAAGGGFWSHVNHIVDTLHPTGLVTGLVQGFDTIRYSVVNSCGAAVAQIIMRVDTTVVALPITGPTTTCVGHTIDLMNGNVLGTWAWDPTNGNATITHAGTLTGAAYGKDTITYVFTNACNSVSSAIVVQIDTPLYAGVISGASNVCVGSWTPLTETESGGIWISSSTGTAIVDGSGNVTGVSQGTVVISYYLSNGCGASVATDTIHVDRPAAPIVGDSVGIGDTVVITDSTIGGRWSISDTLATIDSVTGRVIGVGAGVATVTYSVTNSCGTTYATETLHIGPAPIVNPIAGPTIVCVGGTITLIDTPTTGGIWSGSDSLATVDPHTGVVTGIAAGTVNISYTYTDGFGSTTVVTAITISSPPVISLTGPNIISIGGDYILRAVPAGGTWSSTLADTMGAIVSTYDSVIGGVHLVTYCSFVVVGYGTDTIRYTVSNSCGTADSMFVMNLPPPPPAGVKNAIGQGFGMRVYPNPNQGAITVNILSSVTEDAQLTISNVMGDIVKEVAISTNKATGINLDVPDGIYILSANTSTGKYTSRISVTR